MTRFYCRGKISWLMTEWFTDRGVIVHVEDDDNFTLEMSKDGEADVYDFIGSFPVEITSIEDL